MLNRLRLVMLALKEVDWFRSLFFCDSRAFNCAYWAASSPPNKPVCKFALITDVWALRLTIYQVMQSYVE